ncbi:MAG: aminotransferase class V-fold PLP-dependent enzyme [Sphingomicrobium sp.]
MSFKPLFSQSLSADPDRLHFAAHSHHLWPDASWAGQSQCWSDAAALADRKWDKIMGEIWPEAQGHVARELGTQQPENIVFAPNTHMLLVGLVAAAPRETGTPLRILTSAGEFYSARRQFARWVEAGEIALTEISPEPFDSFTERFLHDANTGQHDLIFVSHMLFGSGRLFEAVEELAAFGRPDGPWVVIDGYHAFMALDRPFAGGAAASAFYLGGGYKYAMAGEGCAFVHAPAGFGSRPPITGWFAEFEDLSLAQAQVGYAPDAARFMGATFDPSGLYRFNAVQQMIGEQGLDTARISAWVAGLQEQLLNAIDGTALGGAELLNPLEGGPHARFFAFRSGDTQRWCSELKRQHCVTDVRGDVLRIGLGLYHDEDDIERFADVARGLR